MKRFLMYCIILVVMLFLGFTTYYFVANKENIALAFDQTSTIKLNVGETFELEKIVVHTDPHANTTLAIDISNTAVLEYVQGTKTFVALSAGNATITITPSNLKFGPFVFNVKVGNGLTQENPYYISNDLELISIGTGDWTLSKCYELIADIYLTTYDWTPLALNSEFTGVFYGNNYTIYNLTMTSANTSTNAGLFDTVGSLGAVKNVKFSNANIVGVYNNAGIVAGINKGTISLCEVSNAILNNTKTSECYSGGIVGSNEFVMTDTTNSKIARIGMCGVENFDLTSISYAGGIAGRNLASLIENCYAVLDTFNGTSAKFGGIVGKNIANNTNFYKNSIINNCHSICYSLNNSGLNGGIVGEDVDFSGTKLNVYSKLYYCMELNSVVGSANYSNPASTFLKKTETEMQAQSTYAGWDFVNVWEMTTYYAKVNFNKIYTSSIIDTVTNPDPDNSDPITETTPDEIYDMVCEMKANPTYNKSYVVNTSYTIDLSETKWDDIFPIGTKESPFKGQFYTSSGITLTFKNLDISNYVYQGFFGYIGSGAIIKGITFNNTTIYNNGTGYIGAICGYADSNSYIYDCIVNGVNFNGLGNIGGAVGCNYGTISDVEVNKSITTTFSNTITANSTTSAGGIVGLNLGLVQNSQASNFTIQAASNSSVYLGGIAGYNSKQVQNSGAKNITINASGASQVKAGGIAGGNENSISSSYAYTVNMSLSTTSTKASCGGITAINTVMGLIDNSMWVNGNITSYYAGGICADNYGKISCSNAGNEDYGHGLVKGNFVGGLAYINQQNARIENCYVTSVLEGLSNSGVVAGFAYEIKGGSIIQNCFSCAAISGKGDFYADTCTGYKNVWIGIWNGLTQNPVGNIKNSLIVNLSGKYIQGYGMLIDLVNNPLLTKYEVTCSEADAKGAENYTCFTSQGFSENIWNFNYAGGHYPTLKNSVTVN